MITIGPVPRPANLISDSPLVQETFDFVRESGGRARFSDITRRIFHLSNVTEELAASLIEDLIENDPRFYVDGSHLAAKVEEVENRLLKDLEFVVVDVEAAGDRSVPARVIEIGACRVYAGEICAEFETLVNPDIPVPAFISSLTGISDEMLKSAPRFTEIVESWLSFAGDSVLVAHNSTFDIALLNLEIARVFSGSRMRNAELCTVQLARRVASTLDSHNLDALAEHFGFEISQRHRATGDARATARVLLHLLDELEIHGVRTLGEARKFQFPRPAELLALDA